MKEKKHASAPWRRWRYGGLSTLTLLLLFAALLAVNLFASRLEKENGWRIDLSFNGITTQSEETREALSQLTSPVHIYALFPKGEEDAPLMELLDRYAAVCPQVTWEQTDPALNPGLIARFSGGTETVDSDSLIVTCEDTGRYRILSPADFVSLTLDEETGNYTYAGYTYERALTGAITYVTQDQIPRAVILQGHGELDGDTLSAFDALLTENHYEVVYQSLADADYTPDPAELLIFFSPMRDLSDAELAKAADFAARGGSFLFTCDYSDPIDQMPNYAALLRSYGFIPLDGIVVADREDANSYYNNIRIDLIPTMLTTDVTLDLVSSGADTLLLTGSRAFETPQETDRNLIASPVLQSGESAYLKSVRGDLTSLEQQEGDLTGPFTLALQARRVTEEGYVSRAFIFGSASLLTNEQIYAMTDSRELVIRVAAFLLDADASGLKIAAKNAVRPALSVRGNQLGSLIVTALPLIVLFAALCVLWPRRNR